MTSLSSRPCIAHCGVQQPDNDSGDQRRKQAVDVKSGHKMGNNQQRKGAEQPIQKKLHSVFLPEDWAHFTLSMLLAVLQVARGKFR